MLKIDLIHPDILASLAAAGHHSKVLIADGNYPVASKLGPNAEIVHLNFMPGLLTCNQVLQGLLTAIAVEEIATRLDPSSFDSKRRDPSERLTALARSRSFPRGELALASHAALEAEEASAASARVSSSRLSLISSSRFLSKCLTQLSGHAFSYSLLRFLSVRLEPLVSRQAK